MDNRFSLSAVFWHLSVYIYNLHPDGSNEGWAKVGATSRRLYWRWDNIEPTYTLKTRVKNPTLLLTPNEQHFMNTSASVNRLSVNRLTCALILSHMCWYFITGVIVSTCALIPIGANDLTLFHAECVDLLTLFMRYWGATLFERLKGVNKGFH